MKFNLTLLESNSEIASAINKALLPDCNSFMTNSLNQIKNGLPSLIHQSIINTPEYNSLINGQLKYELGIPDAETKVAGLLQIWSNNIIYTYNKPTITGNKIKSSFSANTIRVDFSDVLYTQYAEVQDFVDGYKLPWLQWLLLEGNKIIVKKQEVILGPSSRSRTGYALMKGSNKNWKVPSQFAGVESDNWITRAIDNAESSIQELLNKALS